MTEISREILEGWQIRKTKAQKTSFIKWMQEKFPGLRVETGGLCRSRNLVLGDVESAKVVFAAHYDTCAVLPFPNFLTPKNIPLYLLWNILIAIPIFVLMIGTEVALIRLTDSFLIGYLGLLAVFALIMLLMLGGKPNVHTANDNTSGVITLVETILSMTEEERKNAAFVFFDLEEAGLIGSAQFMKAHRAAMKDKLLVNFDCVSDGDHLLMIESKKARAQYGEALEASFVPIEGKEIRIEKSSATLYPSDQLQFPCSVGVAAFNRKRFIGLYMDRIHTKRDTVFDVRNIEYLKDSARRLTAALR